MKKILFLYALAMCFTNANSQITKGNWLVGGIASYSSTKFSFETESTKTIDFEISPNIGYFFTDKFGAGVKLGYGYLKNVTQFGPVSDNTYKLGPFVRFYFLSPEKQFNILMEGAYQYGLIKTNAVSINKNTFSIFGGPVVYFNSSVGLEFLLGYSTSSYKNSEDTENSIRFGIGFQIHLQK